MANGAFKFKDNSGNVVSFISGSGSNISFSGGTLDLSGMTGLTLGNLTLSGTTQNALSASHAASYLLTSSFNTYSGTTDTVIGTLQTSTGSLNSFTSSATTRLNSIETSTGSLNSYTSSNNTKLGVIESTTGSLNSYTSSNNTRLGVIESTTASLNSYTSSNNTKLGVIESTTGSLNSYTSSNTTNVNAIHTSTGSLNTFTSSATTRLDNIETSTGSLNSFTSSATTRLNSIEGVSGSYATTGSNQFKNDQVITGSLTVTGFIDAQELRTTYISSSILYRSGSTKFGDELTDTHSFTGSLSVSGSISVPGSNLVSGSSQVLNGSGVFSGSAQLPSGIVSGSAQTIANLPSGTVSGSVQVDVMSTTNIARLATTGSNVFTGALTGTSATFSTGLVITGNGGVTNSANKFNLDFYGGNSRFYSLGTDTSTKGGYEFHTNSSNGSLDVISLGIASTGAATFYSTGKFNSGITGGSIIFDAATNYGLIQDANSVSRIWFENTGGYRTLFDLPSAGTSFAFRTSAGTIITSITSAGAATFSDALTIRTSSVSSGGSAITAYGYDGAADLHTTRDESPFNAALYLHNNPVTGQGYGTGILFRAKSDTTNSRLQGSIGTTWTTATDGSRTAKMIFSTVNAGVASDKVTILGSGEVGIGLIPTAGNRFWVKGSSTASADTTLYLQNSAGTSLVTVKNSNTTHIGTYTSGGDTLNVSTSMNVRANLTGNEQNIFHVGNTGSGVNDGYMRLLRDGVTKVLIGADNARSGDTYFNGGGKFGINIDNPLATLSTLGGAVQIMGDYRNHATIIKSAGTNGTFSGQLTILIPEMSNASSDGYGGFSCEVYLSAYPGHYCHVWFSGYINGGVTPSEATILRSNGGYSISQSSYGTYNQGFQFIINYPDTFVHPTARIIFNKGGSPNGTAYPANNITAVFS